MSYQKKPFWISLGVTYLYISLLNLVGHQFIINQFIGPAMTAINADFTQFRVYYLMLTWLVITIGTVYFTVKDIPSKELQTRHAAITGALISIIADGTWVFTNTAFVPAITAPSFLIAELSWHTIHGAIGGILALKVYQWALKREKGK